MKISREVSQHPESGAAVLMVMGVGALAMVLVVGTVARLVSERRQVDDSLAQVRAYWAAQGVTNYVLSRSAAAGACAAACDAGQIKKTADGYVSEISSAIPWMYPEVSAAYRIGLNLAWSADSAAPNPYEYVLRSTFSACDGFGANGKIPACPNAAATAGPTQPQAVKPHTLGALRTLNATRPVEVRYCLTSTPGGACGTGPVQGTPGYNAITSVHRPSQ